MSVGGSMTSFFIIAGTLVFLTTFSWPAIQTQGFGFLTKSVFSPSPENPDFGIFGLVTGTALLAIMALIIAFPLSFALAMFIHEYAPRKMRRPMVYVVDLMAALPSLTFGLWGFYLLMGPLKNVADWLGSNLSVVPFFQRPEDSSQSIFIAAVVVAFMITPICTSVMREVFSQTPPEVCEAALALGGTRWGMVRTAILPFARSGMVSAAMLSAGRALGETVAVSLILSVDPAPRVGILDQGGGNVAALIVLRFAESPFADRALMAAGLGLFVVTLVVNMAAQVVVRRSRLA
jgi:phosphate transport system permease protein